MSDKTPAIKVSDVNQPHYVRILRAIREQRHWTQTQLAQALSVSERTIRRWERGESEPNVRDVALFRSMVQWPDGQP